MRRDSRETVLFLDGQTMRLVVWTYTGASLIGQPTAYVYRNKQMVWVRRGESVEWIEVSENARTE